ncbi:uncharacterized protein EI97DRAFT_385586 [Westerdykella ornata]|uniref:RING-type domain-containing protein n=1 Tax=Westerdykella ornata TaxID=318751 RepID=A0A6A6J8E3_WESOR|nr:uncharacterized protein EI97DRAFT_385586 [Westerdykella ornata]KAF2272517.1 hypothetical protein EI97DRAFT_385586 [Westerdykella ornata]
MPPPPEPSRKHPRSSATPGPSAKRQKRQDGARRGSQTSVAAQATEGHIEEIDLSDDKVDIQQILQKQRVDAVKAQQKPEEIKFGTSSCVICMDTPTDITATSCGHLFCHSCLMEALIAGESRTDRGEQRRSQCPVCRKHINRTKPGDTIFLNFWKLPKKSDKA